MAQPQLASIPSKISSYAKIAAMPAPKVATSINTSRKEVKHTTSNPSEVPAASAPKIGAGAVLVEGRGDQDGIKKASVDETVTKSMQKLSLNHASIETAQMENSGDSADSYEEDQSQLSGSSVNKPQSFDTKSLASVTTFAMDDKESIRPDDSASVRAVDDENPHPALSRNSSFQHDTEIHSHKSSRTFSSNVIIPGRRFPTLANPPRFGNLPISPVLETQDVQMPKPNIPILTLDDVREPIPTIHTLPDDKLMDALTCQKDRLSLLQLEEKLIGFIRDGTNDVLDLPPQTSFARMLAHKLADYYGLVHAVTEDNLSVRILRSNSRPLPPPLSELAKSVAVAGTSGPTAAAIKIMRREQLSSRHFSAGNSTAPSSCAPSKTTSENGVEARSDDGLASPTESTPSRDKSKLTREERQAQYKLARDRIFADFQEPFTSDATSNEEHSGSMSRSSSSSGKKKTKKHKQPKDDSFEARSAFVPSGPFQAQYAQAYADPATTPNYNMTPMNYDQTIYGATPTQTFPGFEPSIAYGNMQGYQSTMVPQQISPSDWQAMQAMQMQNPYFIYPQAMQYPQNQNMMMMGALPIQGQFPEWYPSQNQNFMAPSPMSPTSPYPPPYGVITPNSIQNEQYGSNTHRALPNTSTGQEYHSHKRSLFNPQTRSFVPNNREGRSAARSGRTKNNSRHSLNSVMHHQNSNSNVTSLNREDSLKQKYGTPASLPKKPPPQESKQAPEISNNAILQQAHGQSSIIAPASLDGVGQCA
ncbi:hypothetical protein LTR64_005383 [Lithohypha guttulata]|uniref:uncharacterized protein n=1 Tax=Lithohypha guttulata TaxID=1690604 RepID=UPI002DE01F8B|nr:hypothetical protein LTR51_002823 [Lithohypha guttulata]